MFIAPAVIMGLYFILLKKNVLFIQGNKNIYYELNNVFINLFIVKKIEPFQLIYSSGIILKNHSLYGLLYNLLKTIYF